MATATKIQLPETANEIVVRVRAQKVLDTWREGLKNPYQFGVHALLVLFAVLLGLRPGEKRALTWTIAKQRWKEALGRALAVNQCTTTVAQASAVMKAEPKWNEGWNPLDTDPAGTKSIRDEIRDKGEPRMKSCKLGWAGLNIEILHQLDKRGGTPRSAADLVRALNAELGCGFDASDPKVLNAITERLKKMKAKGLIIDCRPGAWCGDGWEPGKEADEREPTAQKYRSLFKVGDRLHQDTTGRKGVVVGIDGEFVEFEADDKGYGKGVYHQGQFTLIHKTPAELDAEAAARARAAKKASHKPEASANTKQKAPPAKKTTAKNQTRRAKADAHGEYWP